MTCRLLYLVGQLGSGGLERQLYLILKNLDQDLYGPELVVWNFSQNDTYVPKIRELGVPLHAVSNGSSRAAKLRTLRGIVMSIRPEVLHSYSFYTNFAAYGATLGTSAVPIGSVRSSLNYAMDGAGTCLGRLSARWPRNQISNNFTSAKGIRRSRSFFSPGKLFVVRNGVDLQEFRSSPISKSLLALIIGVGSLFPIKRWDRLLKAAQELKRSGLDFRVQITGDGPLRNSLLQQANSMGLTDRVEFTGHNDDIPRLLADASFLAHTSDSEGCPNVIMEAMASGRAVVATDVGDVRSLVEDGQTGFVVPRENEAMLVERMAKLLSDPALCDRMGVTGRARAEREFGLERLVQETLDAYRMAGWRG